VGLIDNEALVQRARQIIARYPQGRERSGLLPLLHLVQAEQGYVSPEGIGFCAEILGLTKAQVSAVSTFYTMYKRRPVGDWLVSVCTNTMCGVLGGNKVYEALSERLGVAHDGGHAGEAGHTGVGHDEPSADGAITLEHVECLAACDYAPVMTVNYDFFDGVDAESALELVRQLESGERPQPTRGAGLCTFREISMELAGFSDVREDAVTDGPVGAPTLAGNRLAEEYGISVPGFDPETPIAKGSQ
jgi:NADH-quinone oxidoreductase subunit E